MRFSFFIAWLGIFFFSVSGALAGDFPYRDKYPEVNIVEFTELKTGYDKGDFIIIDLRSKSEFEAIHIRNAINLPYADARFIQKFREITKEQGNKKIAVYDNGIDCIKSYKAAEDALYDLNFNVYAFDAGIASWAMEYPAATLVLGKELSNPGKQLISEKQFIDRNLDFTTFKKMALDGNAVIIDARDPIQRKHDLPGLEKDLNIPVDKLIDNVISKERMKDRKLFIYDQVGRQVQWLMYFLVDKGYSDFYFLDGGATAVLKEQDYRVSFAR